MRAVAHRLLWLATVSLYGQQSSLAAQSHQPGDWLAHRYNATNTAAVILDVDCIAKGWTFRPQRRYVQYQPGMSVWSSPAIGLLDQATPIVVIGSFDHSVYVLNACTGKLLWRYTTGGCVCATPLIFHDQQETWIYVASDDRVVYGLDARDGSRHFSHAVADYQPTLGGSRLSAPCLGQLAQGPTLFVGYWVWDKSLAQNRQVGGFTALSAVTGKRLWQKRFVDNQVSAPVFATVREHAMVFVASADGNLRALAADTGELVWIFRETEPIMSSPLVFSSQTGMRVAIGSHFGKLRLLDAVDGKEIWSFKTGNWITGSAALLSRPGGKQILFGSYDRRLYALDALTGNKIWSLAVAGPIYSSPAVFYYDRQPIGIFSAWDNHVHAVSAEDGVLMWSMYTGQPMWDGIVQGESNWASPAVAKLGQEWMIFHGSYDGTLYAVPMRQAAISSGAQPWSTWRFWLTMVLVVLMTTSVAIWLTRRQRLRSHPSSARSN